MGRHQCYANYGWKEFSQSDEDELIAISFTSYSDLERGMRKYPITAQLQDCSLANLVHAPHGVLHSVNESPSVSCPTDMSKLIAKSNS